MIDFPIAELMDDDVCTLWLERYLHPQGFVCPRCGDAKRRLFRAQEHFPAYRCRACEGYYTLLTGTVFEKTRQRPAGSNRTWACTGCSSAAGNTPRIARPASIIKSTAA